MDGSTAMAIALGHVRNAVAALVEVDDPSGESLFLAAECLELEGLFSEFDVVAEMVDPEVGAPESLDLAAEALSGARPAVPLVLWASLQALRARATR